MQQRLWREVGAQGLRGWRQRIASLAVPRMELRALGVLAALGVALVALNGWVASWSTVPAHPRSFLASFLLQLAIYAVAAVWVIRHPLPARGALAVIVLIAIASRLVYVMQPPSVSDDIFRYVWDGRIQSMGLNPYRYTPADPAVAQFRDEIIAPLINRQGVPTIYPPVAQFLFAAIYFLHPDSVAWTKFALIGIDLLTLGTIAALLPRLGLRRERVLLYAWHPLLILELGHSGHIDIAMLAFLALALMARLDRRPWRVGFFLACAALTKFYALLALPALLDPRQRRDPRLMIGLFGTAALAYFPFLGVGGRVFGYLGGYVQEEGVASGARFYPLALLMGWNGGAIPALELPLGLPTISIAFIYLAGIATLCGLLALWCWLVPPADQRSIPERALLLCATFIVVSTPTYPWYSLLPLVFIPLVRARYLAFVLPIVSAAGLLYLQWWWPATAVFVRACVYGGGFLILVTFSILALLSRRSDRRGRSAVAAAVDEGEQESLFEHFPWFYAACRQWFFRDHTAAIERVFWPIGSPRVGDHLLELGCGPGHYARRLAGRYRQLRVSGLDRSPAQLRHARARAAAQRLPNCQFVAGDARALDYADASIESVIVSRLFTILPEREDVIAEVYRVLAPGGRCFIAEPQSRFWTALPLRALWSLARWERLCGWRQGDYREPRSAVVLTDESFAVLVRAQPWATATLWHDRYYRYAACEKGRRAYAIDTLAAD